MLLRGEVAEDGVFSIRLYATFVCLLTGMSFLAVHRQRLIPSPFYQMSKLRSDLSNIGMLESSIASVLEAWIEELGMRFDPFGPLDAASDARLFEYLVGHKAFARVWGDWPSWAFAPPGGGKTALRVRTAQACWVGQMANHPFPISYVLPFLSWGHTSPTLDDHLAALARAGAMTLLMALAYRPHWLLELDASARQDVRDVLNWNLPGPLSSFLEPCRQSKSLQPLRELDPMFTLPDPPDADTLLRWCDALDAVSNSSTRPSPATCWNKLSDLLLETLRFRSIYVLVDGLDAAPETVADAQRAVDCLKPLLPLVKDLADQRILVKGFLPIDVQSLLIDQFPKLFVLANNVVIRWEPAPLAEVIRRRVYVASEGAFGSLDAISSPAVRDVETMLAKEVPPLPREILVLTRRVLEEHVRSEGNGGRIQERDIEAAIQWYHDNQPKLALENSLSQQ